MADAKLIIKPPHLLVRLKPGFWPDLPKMLRTVKEAGYTPIPDRTVLRLTGRLVRSGGGLALEVDGLKTAVTLPLAASEPGLSARLERSVGQGVDVEGAWQPAPPDQPGPGALAVATVHGEDGR